MGDLTVNRLFLEYIGADTIKYFDILLYAYYLLLGIVVFKTYRIIKDYRNGKNNHTFSKSFTKYDLAVTLLIIGVQLISMMFIYAVFIEYVAFTFMYKFIVVVIISIILLIIQYRIYTKLYDALY